MSCVSRGYTNRVLTFQPWCTHVITQTTTWSCKPNGCRFYSWPTCNDPDSFVAPHHRRYCWWNWSRRWSLSLVVPIAGWISVKVVASGKERQNITSALQAPCPTFTKAKRKDAISVFVLSTRIWLTNGRLSMEDYFWGEQQNEIAIPIMPTRLSVTRISLLGYSTMCIAMCII